MTDTAQLRKLAESLRGHLSDYDQNLRDTIVAGILPDRASYGEDVSGVTYAEITEAASAIISLLDRIEALEGALTLAQRWLANSVPTVDFDGPKPLPVIAALLTSPETPA
jgi:hypothetical protein